MLSETFLAMTIFKNEIDSIFVFAFANLITIKIFHWILRDRIEYVRIQLILNTVMLLLCYYYVVIINLY